MSTFDDRFNAERDRRFKVTAKRLQDERDMLAEFQILIGELRAACAKNGYFLSTIYQDLDELLLLPVTVFANSTRFLSGTVRDLHNALVLGI